MPHTIYKYRIDKTTLVLSDSEDTPDTIRWSYVGQFESPVRLQPSEQILRAKSPTCRHPMVTEYIVKQ